jgi:hypothetical protein
VTRPQLTASDPYQFYLLLFPICKCLANNNPDDIIDPSSHCRISLLARGRDLESTTQKINIPTRQHFGPRLDNFPPPSHYSRLYRAEGSHITLNTMAYNRPYNPDALPE